MRRIVLAIALLFMLSQFAEAQGRRRSRIRFGRVEFGIPFVDSFVTVHGDRTTVKVFSRGDITNVHTDSGVQVDVGIRSVLIGREPMRGPGVDPADREYPGGETDAPPFPDSSAPEVNLGESQPSESVEEAPPKPLLDPEPAKELQPNKGQEESKEPTELKDAPPAESETPVLIPQRQDPSPQSEAAASEASLEQARQANVRGDYQAAEAAATQLLEDDDENHAAYSVRAAALIGQGEKQRDPEPVRRGLADINKAIKLGKEQGNEDKQDYLVWLIGMNQLAATERDPRATAANARMVDRFTSEHMDRFPNDMKEKVFHQQGFARLLLGRQSDAEASFREASKFGTKKPVPAPVR